jgi:hypothetical protein
MFEKNGTIVVHVQNTEFSNGELTLRSNIVLLLQA